MSMGADVATESIVADADRLSRYRRLPLYARIRFQLGGALLFGSLIPALLVWPEALVRPEALLEQEILPSFSACAVAIVMGYILVRNSSPFSGRLALGYVLPGLLASFTLVAVVMVYFRIHFEPSILVASYVVSSLWLLFAYVMRNRHALPTLAVVPVGNVGNLNKIPDVVWVRLAEPSNILGEVDALVIDHRAKLADGWERFVTACVLAGVPVYDVRHASELLTGRVSVESLAENSFGTLLPSSTYHQIKRAFDIVLSIAALPLFLLVIAVTAVLIRLETPGSVLFTQPRMGYRGRPFTIYKLRSMRTDYQGGTHFTAENDPRITRVGHFIRKYRIDEYPQIFNVLKGDMSWIGPRPEAMPLAEWYAREVPFYMYRHAVRPGLTGWAQIHQGNVAQVEAACAKLQYDFYYTKYYSAALDLIIVFRTFKTVLTGFGSR